MWTFKRICGQPINNDRISDYEEALMIAMNSSVANPCFSKYSVQGSIGNSKEIIPCGNIEYGLCQALHGEECGVGAFRSMCKDKLALIGIITSGDVATPCGNCRDILRQTFDDIEIVSGSKDGGTAIVASIKDYLFDIPKKLSEYSHIYEEVKEIISQQQKLTNDAYSNDIYPERKYTSLIVTENNKFYGGHDVMCDYHPIYALRDAIRQSRRANDPFIKFVIVACENVLPDVMYKDRQHLLELNLQAELLSKKEQDPIVYLLSYHHLTNSIINVATTSVKEWIPFPFNPRNLGPLFINHLTDYYSNKIRNQHS